MKVDKKNLKRGKWITQEGVSLALRSINISLVSLWVIRTSGVDIWGAIVTFLIAAELMFSVVSWGQRPWLMRQFSTMPKDINASWWLVVISRLILFLFISFLVSFIPILQPYLWELYALVFLRVVAGSIDPIIQYRRKYSVSILSESLSILLSLSLLIFYFKEISVDNIILSIIAGASLKLLILTKVLPKLTLSGIGSTTLINNLKISWPFFALAIAGLFQSKGELYVVNYFLSEAEIGFYHVLIGFLIMAQTFAGILLGPFQKNIYRLKPNEVQNLKKPFVRLGLASTIVFSIGLFLALLYVYKFTPSLIYLPLIFLYLIPLYAYLIECQVLIKHNSEQALLKFNLVAAIINIVLAIGLIPIIGVVGALISGIISRIILAIMVVHKSGKLQLIND
ncbi:MAG: hypothetical protein CL840_16980 [Crocinitomicaceae bacterium]|nr:hypothetical protein [Crocinitomicaceae bacterium]|tara:strand:- start:12222 stop:13409 length:1188 start_codon:yes stop_codon:yes gene_type:complete